MKKLLSIDAETNGLHGAAFAVSAVLRKEDGTTEEFILRCPIEGDVEPWVAENVLPQMTGIPKTCNSYIEMLEKFAQFYMANKENCTVIVHCGLPVEARLFIDMHHMGFIGDWDMPLPLVDVSAMLLLVGEDPTSVDTYNAKNGLKVKEMEGGTHNPLYDSWAALLAYDHMMQQK